MSKVTQTHVESVKNDIFHLKIIAEVVTKPFFLFSFEKRHMKSHCFWKENIFFDSFPIKKTTHINTQLQVGYKSLLCQKCHFDTQLIKEMLKISKLTLMLYKSCQN